MHVRAEVGDGDGNSDGNGVGDSDSDGASDGDGEGDGVGNGVGDDVGLTVAVEQPNANLTSTGRRKNLSMYGHASKSWPSWSHAHTCSHFLQWLCMH